MIIFQYRYGYWFLFHCSYIISVCSFDILGIYVSEYCYFWLFVESVCTDSPMSCWLLMC